LSSLKHLALNTLGEGGGAAPPVLRGLSPVALREREPGKIADAEERVRMLRPERLLPARKRAL